MSRKRLVLYQLNNHNFTTRNLESGKFEIVSGNRGETIHHRLTTFADLVLFHGEFPRLEKDYKKILSIARSRGIPIIYHPGSIHPGRAETYPAVPSDERSRTLLAVIRASLDADAVVTASPEQMAFFQHLNPKVHPQKDFFSSPLKGHPSSSRPKSPRLFLWLARTSLTLNHRLIPPGSLRERLWLMPGRALFILMSEGWPGVSYKIRAKIPGLSLRKKAPFSKTPLSLPVQPPRFKAETASASIIVLTHNNLNYTRLCLESIIKHTRHPDYEIVIVDNASEDGTPEFLQAFSKAHAGLNIRLLFNDQNRGFAAGNNQGAEMARGEVLVMLNNDTVVTEGWLSGLVRHLTHPAVGLVGPVTNASPNASRIDVSYCNLDELAQLARARTQGYSGQAFEIPALIFFCVALRREVYEAIGPLDPQFGVGMFEDDDYCLRLAQHGYHVVCAEDVFVHHWGSASLAQLTDHRYWKLHRENRIKFEHKWGLKWDSPMLPY